MKLLVTAGNTAVPIDRVRQITNVFTGRTGAAIALHAYRRGHDVTLVTSHPETVRGEAPSEGDARWHVVSYRTFDELAEAMEATVRTWEPDAVVHSAAVSDYLAGGIYAPTPGTQAAVIGEEVAWESDSPVPPRLVSVAAGKVKSDAPELWLRLVRAPKIIDRIRSDWGFWGVLVKFKLEVAVDEERLLEVAEASRRHSQADLMVANTLETAAQWAYLGPCLDGYRRIPRAELPERLLEAIDALSLGR